MELLHFPERLLSRKKLKWTIITRIDKETIAMVSAKYQFCLISATLLFLLTTCSTSSASGSSNLNNAPGSPVPFPTFLQNVARAHYDDYAHLSTTRVRDEPAFEEMRAYILKLYADIQVVNTYLVDGRSFDCVVPRVNPSSQPRTSEFSKTVDQGTCQEGSIPMERVTLERLVRFPTVQAFLQKSPGGKEGPPSSSSNGERKG
jgi:hypothetical protein